MRALVAVGDGTRSVRMAEVDDPRIEPDQVVVRVTAVSLNRGEIRRLSSASAGDRIGWDVVGVVEEEAGDGSGPPLGARVVGLSWVGWAERVTLATRLLAPIPDDVTDAQASTLPVAGITARRALDVCGPLEERRVLVTGAAGGVGRLAVQLARADGAGSIVGVARDASRAAGLRELGATAVVEDLAAAEGDFDVILESVGGPVLTAALDRVAPGGTVVTFGQSGGEPAALPSAWYNRSATLYGFIVFAEIERAGGATDDLIGLLELIRTGRLDPQVVDERPWTDAQGAIDAVYGRSVNGKAVLHVD